jgi:hypothetical protein
VGTWNRRLIIQGVSSTPRTMRRSAAEAFDLPDDAGVGIRRPQAAGAADVEHRGRRVRVRAKLLAAEPKADVLDADERPDRDIPGWMAEYE